MTIYYWWQNTKGIEESTDKALNVMQVTTVMVVLLLGVGIHHGVSHARQTAAARPCLPTCTFRRMRSGFLSGTRLATMLGLFGILMAFGHSVLAMSGEETLAQVNREIEHPKLKNLKRAAIVIAIYSFIFTGVGTLLATMIIPDAVRVPVYRDNLIAGMAMYMWGPSGSAHHLPRLRGHRRISDSLRRHQYVDHRLHGRDDARRRRRRADRTGSASRTGDSEPAIAS